MGENGMEGERMGKRGEGEREEEMRRRGEGERSLLHAPTAPGRLTKRADNRNEEVLVWRAGGSGWG